jgi:hypothetical protein
MPAQMKDLTAPVEAAGLHWDPADIDASMDRLKAFAIGRAADAVSYYQRVKRPKKWWAVRLRLAALLGAGAAGLLPLISQIFVTDQGRPYIAPAWASVFLALAAGAVAIDRYFGLSSAWMRFMTSELQVRRSLDEFEFGWESARAWFSEHPEQADVHQMIELARSFVTRIADIVQHETDEWMSEFRETIRQLDERTGRRTLRGNESETTAEESAVR